jgi:preprotein translocase subunit SecY
MWIGELITQKGIGNGMSLLIFSSILTSAPAGINAWWNGSGFEKLSLPIVILAVVTGVVYVQEGIRKIPIQYAKRMVGRRMTSGGSTYLPLRVNMAGVIPVIFASAIMILPATVASLLPGTLGPQVAQWFQFTSWPYIIGESLLIFAFTFFYVAVVFNSLEQADNLKKYGGFIPGIRPGRPTAVPGHRRRRADAVHQVRRVQHGHRACAGRNLRADRGWRCHRYHASDRVAAFDAQLQGLPEVGRRCLST